MISATVSNGGSTGACAVQEQFALPWLPRAQQGLSGRTGMVMQPVGVVATSTSAELNQQHAESELDVSHLTWQCYVHLFEDVARRSTAYRPVGDGSSDDPSHAAR